MLNGQKNMGFADGIPLVAGVTVASLLIIVLVALILCCCCSSCVMYRKDANPKLLASRSAEPSPTRTVLSTTTSNGYTVTYTVCSPTSTMNAQEPLINDLSNTRNYGLGLEEPRTSMATTHLSHDRIHLTASHERMCNDLEAMKLSDYDESDDTDTESDFDGEVWVPRRDMALRKVRIHEPLRQSYVDLAS